MLQLCNSVLDHILKKWPEAELYTHNSLVLHDMEVTVTLPNRWFITLTTSGHHVSAIVCRITNPVKDNKQGFEYVNEFQVSIPENDRGYVTSYTDHTDASQLVKFHWSLDDLIDNLALDSH
ncbi:hypothetical protein [Dyadobacter sp. NIV53]|uniref:hypothetical protein n=1 Tax=Dyadobacter sp. NIV53 TaxID=2861765 RepID=UPI001C8745E2|nr:hypothetical protein [Dyadobacter sp. NIV53]